MKKLFQACALALSLSACYNYTPMPGAYPRTPVEPTTPEESTNHLRDTPIGMCRSFNGRIGACGQPGFDWYDRDGDGVRHDIDNCPYTVNPLQTDSNNNGVGDACENDPVQLLWQGNPGGDADNDGINNNSDGCPMTNNRGNNRDSDGDGVPDICDIDANGDGIID